MGKWNDFRYHFSFFVRWIPKNEKKRHFWRFSFHIESRISLSWLQRPISAALTPNSGTKHPNGPLVERHSRVRLPWVEIRLVYWAICRFYCSGAIEPKKNIVVFPLEHFSDIKWANQMISDITFLFLSVGYLKTEKKRHFWRFSFHIVL